MSRIVGVSIKCRAINHMESRASLPTKTDRDLVMLGSVALLSDTSKDNESRSVSTTTERSFHVTMSPSHSGSCATCGFASKEGAEQPNNTRRSASRSFIAATSLLRQRRPQVLPVQPRDMLQADVLRALDLAGTGVAAVAKTLLVHLLHHGQRAALALGLALGKQ